MKSDKRILVVDDEPSIVDVLTRFLSREGYSVITAVNGREALERVRQDPPEEQAARRLAVEDASQISQRKAIIGMMR